MPTDSIRAALERLISAYDEHGGRWPDHHVDALHNAVKRARADLAAEPPDPADGGEALLAAATTAPLVGDDKSGCARIELVTAIYCLASHYEIACSDLSGDDLRKARSDIAHARCIAAKHNQNGSGCPQFPFARWGRPAAPAAPAEGEVGKLVAWLNDGELVAWLNNHAAHLRTMEGIGALPETELQERLDRAATLLQQQAAELAALRTGGDAGARERVAMGTGGVV